MPQDAGRQLTAKQALKQLVRQVERLGREIEKLEAKGTDPWQHRLDLGAIKYAIPLIEERMHRNAEKHEGGTQPVLISVVLED